MATNTLEPITRPEWIRPGMHLSSHRPHEIDLETFRKADVVSFLSLRHRPRPPVVIGPERELSREILTEYSGADPTEHLLTDLPVVTLAELAARRERGRSAPEQVTIFLNNYGHGIQFAALGALVLEAARERGLGQEIPDDWFLQPART